MKPLHLKLLRDMLSMRGQVVSIALVIACGVAICVMALVCLDSLQKTRASYYARARFGDVFARLERAPESLESDIRRIPGVDQVETRIVFDVTLNVPGLAEPAVGRLISVPDSGESRLDRLHVRIGRLPDPVREGEVAVGEAFAGAHRMRPGDTVEAVINGRLRQLRITGIVLSPEYIFQILDGEILPDDRRFGVFWIGENQLAASFDMEGSFNDVALTRTRESSEARIRERLDRILDPYGGLGSFGRYDQRSNRYLSEEIRQLRSMALVAPLIFLAVSAILLNLILSRLVNLQREEIAALRAFGYRSGEIALHYVQFVALIVMLGVVPGTLLGLRMGRGLLGLYVRFYHFPQLEFHLDPRIPLVAMAISLTSGLVGALGVIWRASRLPPAQAMRPEAPATYRPTWVERLGIQAYLSMGARMVLRNLQRRPVRSLFTCLGIAMSVALLILGGFMRDSIDYVMDREFGAARREDLTVTFVQPSWPGILDDLSRLTGVMFAEPFRIAPVRLRSGPRERLTSIQGVPAGSVLFRPAGRFDLGRNVIPPAGLVVSRKLAELLEAAPGDTIQVEVLEGRRPRRRVTLAGQVEDMSGIQGYMSLPALNALLQEGPRVSGAYLRVHPGERGRLYTQLKRTPVVATVTVKEAAMKSFRDTIAENLLIMQSVNLVFAVIMSIGVAYSVSRISLAERSRELATLRVLGLTRAEISFVLLGELTVLVLLSLPLGLFLGRLFGSLVVLNTDTEIFRFPLVIRYRTYGSAVAVVLAASLAAGLFVRRLLDRLDLISVLKEKE